MTQGQTEKSTCQVKRQGVLGSIWWSLGGKGSGEKGVEAGEECREQRTKGCGLLAMLRILDFIPMKWKAFEVVGLAAF